uniref:Endonuclease/exonuclease/phosphatase domain-containing protein n=1 Tax=Gouania willdenowi TaxID=441366 RepID=A0A8C5EMP2_GOUWI
MKNSIQYDLTILIKKNVPFILADCIKDTGGRYVIVRGILYGEGVAFMSLYCPPGQPGGYVVSAFTKLVNFNIRNLVVGGDFNCHLNPLMDKSPAGKQHLLPQAKLISKLCEELAFVDVWRAQHLTDKEFTFFSKVHTCYTRIDYFFVPKSLLPSITSSSIGSIVISDHAAVFIECSIGGMSDRTSRWHFDSSILYDKKFASFFVEEFKQFFSINAASTDNPSLLWETSKAYSRGLITSYTKSKRRRQTEQRIILESKLKKAEQDYLIKSSNGKLKEISALRSALDCLLTNEAERKMRFAKQKLYEHGDKPGRYLAYLTKKKDQKSSLDSPISRKEV